MRCVWRAATPVPRTWLRRPPPSTSQRRSPTARRSWCPPSAPHRPGGPRLRVAARGLVDLNSATPEELDTLPGIGPVTVQKIVAARTERPFATLEEAVEREVLNNGQLEKIRDLATVR